MLCPQCHGKGLAPDADGAWLPCDGCATAGVGGVTHCCDGEACQPGEAPPALREYLAARRPGPFRPGAFYNRGGDHVEVWLEDAPGVSESVGDCLTVTRCVRTGRVVGVKVHGARALVLGGGAAARFAPPDPAVPD